MSEQAGAPAEKPTARAAAGRVDALDGLRTIAVFLVVLFHVRTPHLDGGFLGVDVFFVLSGFLITTLLLTEAGRKGRPDLGRFWARRVLRLMPASVVVILTVLVWTVVAAPPFRVATIATDAAWSLLYVGNWRFVTSANYFADDGTSSPLLHVWSLAVEEQFYLGWPLLVTAIAVGAVAYARRRAADDTDATQATRAMTLPVVVVAALLGLASTYLLFRLWQPVSPDRAYMGTDAKIVEPLIGAALAAVLLRPGPRAFVARHAAWLGPAGLLGLAVGVAKLSGPAGPRMAYFAGGAVLFSLCVAALVGAVALQDPRRGLARALGWGPIAYLGRISYGIYLWHWPLAVWLLPAEGFSAARATLVVGLTVALAALSFHLLETPLRLRFTRTRPARVLASAALVLALTTSAAVAVARVPLTTLLDARGVQASTTMVVGDSVIQRLTPDLAAQGQQRNIIVGSASRGGCSVIGAVTVTGAGAPLDPVCADMPATQAAELQKQRPDTVVWWSRYELADRLGPDGRILRASDPEFWALQQQGLDDAVRRLTATGARLVIVEPDRPGTGIWTQCEPTGCEPFLTRLAEDTASRERWTAMLRAKTSDPRVTMITIDDVYCRDAASPCDDRLPLRSGDGFPPPAADLARPDGSHFTSAAAGPVAGVLLDRMVAATKR